ncbi:MAG: FkbM family methyltransferase [Armatimonadetes bacterium]|nr:FkbM family methyltransferase [Armatimonadota bacterium]
MIELGAGIGVVAGTTNRLLADPGRHVVVEANPALLPLLEESRQANGCGYRLRHLAVAYGGPSVELSLGTTFQASSVAGRSGDAARTVTVPACTVADVAREAAFEHFSLICDIEGEEYELFEREGDLLRDRVGFLIVELHDRPHGREQIERGEARLLALGFERVAGSGKCRAYVNRALVST